MITIIVSVIIIFDSKDDVTVSIVMCYDRKEIEGMMAIVIKGDALQPDSIQKAFDQIEEVDAVVSTIGGTPADPTADSQVSMHQRSSATAT